MTMTGVPAGGKGASSVSEDSSSAAWLRQARSYLRHDDPVLARLIDDRPDFDPATAHFRLAGHPVVRWYEPGEGWYWCYLDRLVFELEGAPAAPSRL
jgi:hypothetical protein